MRFILSMTRRELRTSWKRLLFFFLCIAIGVGSIVALRSMIQNINRAVAGEARSLLTADVRVDTDRPWSDDVLEAINRAARPELVEARTETIESATMARPADPGREGAMMIEVKGIEPEWPLVGDFYLRDGRRFDGTILADHGAAVAPSLLDRLNLQVGDKLRIGNSIFEIRGVFDLEPGGSGGFRLGPTVYIERQSLEQAGLVGFGSRARRRILFRTPEGRMPELVTGLKDGLKNKLVNVRSYRDSQENLNEQFERAENYLSLTGLVVLVLGGIGISNVTRVFIEQKKKTIAVLKCIGGTGRQVTIVYLAQVIVLGLAGSLLGIGLAKAALFVAGKYFSESLPPNLEYGLQAGAVWQGLGVGVLISILFSALPLLRIRRIKPNVLLRDAVEPPSRRVDWLRWTVGALVLIGLILVVSWQAGSLQVGALFLAGLAVTAGALHLAATLVISLVKRLRHVRSFVLRQAVNSLYRPGNQTRVIVMVVGLGVFLVLAIQSLQENLVREFDIGRQGELPNMFMIDIQRDQVEGLSEIVAERTGQPPLIIPTVRMRIAAINGQEVDLDQIEVRRDRGRLGREYVTTYRPHLEVNEEIVAGQFWEPTPSPDPEVSIEESMRGLAGLDLGSTMTFDIQGRKLTARVTSFRRVDWRNSRTGFMIVFRPGPLDEAPQMMISAINGPADEVERSRFQRAIVDRYPNISIIDIGNIVETVKRIVNNITLAVTFIGGFVFLSGALILIGSIAMTKFQRIYEAAVMKTLGARRKTLLAILLFEYALLGLVAGLIGAIGSVGLSYASARYVFEIPWSLTPALTLAGLLGTVALVVIVGAASTLDVLSRKPLAILRSQ